LGVGEKRETWIFPKAEKPGNFESALEGGIKDN
jgi:hypothetical protein